VRAAWAAYAAICIIWGTTFVAIRVAIETIPTLLVTGVRFVVAGIILFTLCRLTGSRLPAGRREWIHQAISGIVMAGAGNALVVYAEHSITSGVAALLAATIPIWMAVMESMLGRAPLTLQRILGLTLGFGGVFLLVAPAIGEPDVSVNFFLAVGAMQLNAIFWNGGTLYSRSRPTHADPLGRSAVQMLAAGIAVTLLAYITGERITLAMFSARSTAALLYLIIFGSVVAYWSYNFALTKLSAGKVSSYAYVNPAVAVIFGAILLSEPITITMIVAMVVILAGVATVQLEAT
jgi:drug/metabolite transporter (DMT)-like permease